jgi:hypothetical protein
VIWLATCRNLWKERNSWLFLQKGSIVENLVYKVKIIAWWWLETRKNDFNFDLNMWWLNPLACLRLYLG